MKAVLERDIVMGKGILAALVCCLAVAAALPLRGETTGVLVLEPETRAAFSNEAKALLVGKVPGEMMLVTTMAGVSVGDSAGGLVARFGEPTYSGPTEGRELFEMGWPGHDMMVYIDNKVAFICADEKVSHILVGVGLKQFVEELPREDAVVQPVAPVVVQGGITSKQAYYLAYGEPFAKGPSKDVELIAKLYPGCEFAFWSNVNMLVVFTGDGSTKDLMTGFTKAHYALVTAKPKGSFRVYGN